MATDHQVVPGDCISSIAYENGFFPDTVWNHPNNAALKERRQDSGTLMPGDSVHVPDKRVKVVSEPVDASYRFKRKGVPARLRFIVMHFGQPVRSRPYTLDVDGKSSSGETGDDGLVDAPIPPNAKTGKLVVDAGEHRIEVELELGHLDPVGELRGFKQRLHSMGYAVGEPDDTSNEAFEAAVRRFEAEHGLDVTGARNVANQKKLTELHGR